MDLKDTPSKRQHLDVAELSRPAREIKARLQEKNRQPQGRPKTSVNRPAMYTNWFTPFAWQCIKDAQVKAASWSATSIANVLKQSHPSIFSRIRPSTIDGWIDRKGPSGPHWTDKALTRANDGNNPQYNPEGRPGILVSACLMYMSKPYLTIMYSQTPYPEITKTTKDYLTKLRNAGAPISVVTARGIMLAMILERAPEILEKEFSDGSKFRASETFVRQWLHKQMHWSIRKATRTAQKLPEDWEDKCEKSALRKAHLIKKYDIPAELFINADQTQMVYAPGDKMTWAETGTSQVSLLRNEEKRAFTVVVGVAASGEALPFQAVYKGKSDVSCPSNDSPFFEEATEAGIKFVFSGTDTYWSNHETMHQYVNKVLVPYIQRQKEALNLPDTQMTLWSIDVWAVHRSKEFRTWMRMNHPRILLDYVPGGTTGVAQPCDVGIQRTFKLSAKRSYHEDVVKSCLAEIRKGSDILKIDDRIKKLRNASVRWLVNAFNTINNEELVQKVSKFAMNTKQTLTHLFIYCLFRHLHSAACGT